MRRSPGTGASSTYAQLLCPELPVALHVRCKETEGLAIGAGAGATRCRPCQRLPGAPRQRKNAPVTRNVRLAAIKSFFRFLEYRQPAALEHVRRVLSIPFKTDRRLVPYLLREEIQAVLDAPDPTTRDGIRDRAMLHLAVCGGLRVSELTGLKLEGHRSAVDVHSCSW